MKQWPYDEQQQPYEQSYDGQHEPPTYHQPYQQQAHQQPEVRATIYHKVRWLALVPYLAALITAGIAVAVLFMTAGWKSTMQAQIDQLRHQVANVQQQAASGDTQLQQNLSGLAGHISDIRSTVNGLQASSYAGVCSIAASGPRGVSTYAFHCR
jgi:hypothetical protein